MLSLVGPDPYPVEDNNVQHTVSQKVNTTSEGSEKKYEPTKGMFIIFENRKGNRISLYYKTEESDYCVVCSHKCIFLKSNL